MSNIRKSFVSDHRSVMSPNSNTVISHPIHNFKPVFSKPNIENQLMNHQANRNYSNNAPPQQEEKKIGNFKPMNQNVIVPTDTNDKPMI